jgi:6-phosphogluconolactonase
MKRRALHAATLASVLGFWGCGSGADSGSRPGVSAGSGSGGQAAGGAAASGGAAGSNATAGASSAGAPSGGAPSGGTATGASGSSGVGGGGAGGPAQLGGTPLVYVGGFGNFPLRVYELNKATGALTQRGGDEDGGRSPSYLALDPLGTHLYNANEDNGTTAGVTAHHIKADGTLEPLNHQQGTDNTPAATCNGSCGFTHVAVDPSGKFVIAADYDGGSVSVFPINQDGSLGAEKQLLDFGSQAAAHCVAFDPAGKYAFVPTLGANAVQQLKLGADGMWSANTPPDVASPGNAGPRHMAMHPSGKLAFVINETASSLTPYTISADGKLTAGTSVSSLPQGFSGESYGQHVKVSPDGRFVYGSNVGHDSIVVFTADQNSGALTPLQDQPSGGAWPRDFDLDPNGEVLVVANRDSNSLAVFTIAKDGKLTPLGQPTTVPDQPSSVVIRYNK